MIVVAPNQQYGVKPRGDYRNSIVFLDGVKQDCFYADDVAGVIKKFVFNPRGDWLNSEHYPGEPAVNTFYGNVTIITRRA